jgi:hypothetical protein
MIEDHWRGRRAEGHDSAREFLDFSLVPFHRRKSEIHPRIQLSEQLTYFGQIVGLGQFNKPCKAGQGSGYVGIEIILTRPRCHEFEHLSFELLFFLNRFLENGFDGLNLLWSICKCQISACPFASGLGCRGSSLGCKDDVRPSGVALTLGDCSDLFFLFAE